MFLGVIVEVDEEGVNDVVEEIHNDNLFQMRTYSR